MFQQPCDVSKDIGVCRGQHTFLAAVSAPGDVIPQELCSLVILSGLLSQISAKLVLWRSFGIVAAVREVKVAGPYRVVRHPMYLGYDSDRATFA
jgi:protein-S-isoprenylcysteine O-methyltransferase Ste14